MYVNKLFLPLNYLSMGILDVETSARAELWLRPLTPCVWEGCATTRLDPWFSLGCDGACVSH